MTDEFNPMNPEEGHFERAFNFIAFDEDGIGFEESSRLFNEWLDEERAKAWDLARSEVRSVPSWYNPETGKGGFDLQPPGPDASSEEGAWNAVMEILDQNPYRKADQ